jgi:hypothetical protein
VALTRLTQSEETILPEDEDTDAMSIDAVAIAAVDATTAFDALALGMFHLQACAPPRCFAIDSKRHEIVTHRSALLIADFLLNRASYSGSGI